jgi:hypothetical protein
LVAYQVEIVCTGAWKSAEMVRRYAHFAPEQLRAEASVFRDLTPVE